MAKQLTPAQEKVWARIIRAATDVDVFISQTGNNMIVWNGSGVRHSTLQALDKAGMIKLVAPDAWQFRITQLIPGYNTPAIPATGTETQAAFGVGDYVVIKPDCTVGELSFIREKGRIGRIVDVSGILRAEFHVIRISPKYCELADFAALSSEPDAGSDADNEIPVDVAIDLLDHQRRSAEYHMEGYRDALEKVRKALRLFQGDDFYVSMALGIIDGTLEDEPVGE